MKNILKTSAVVFGYKLLFTLLALAFFYSFSYLLSFSNGLIIYSSVISLMYFSAVYSYIWKIGKKDGRKNTFKIWEALLSVLISELPTVIISAVYFLNKSDISEIVYRIYQFIYIGFISSDVSKVIVIIPVFIFAALGYILGYKNFEIYDRILMKIVYRKR